MPELRDSPARRRASALPSKSEASNGEVKRGGKKIAYSSCSEGRLLWWDEIPKELQFNAYISSGYRANLTYSQCLCSLFALHNETGNVWLHFIPGLAALGLLIWRLAYFTDQPHEWAFYAVLVPTTLCMALSCAYHLLMAQVKHYHAWLTADICGVFSVMVLPFFSTAFWGYHCQPLWQKAVLGAYCSGALVCTLLAAFAKTSATRAAPMGVLLLVRVLSLAHRWVLNTSSPEAIKHVACMEIMCFIGANINVFRVPERWLHDKQQFGKQQRKAGLLDYWGNSHQLMHVLSVLALWHIYQSVRSDVDFMRLHPGCP